MKKTYKKLGAFIGLLTAMAFTSNAALQGTVTVNSQAGTTSGVTYQSFTALAQDLNTLGVSGPLYVNVLPNTGPYVEQVTFNQITGMGPNARVTINGNNNLLTFNATSSAPHTLRLNGTDFLEVMNLKMEGTNTSYAIVAMLQNGADNNMFSACTFSCPQNGSSSIHAPFSITGSSTSNSTGGNANNNTVRTSTLSGGYYSIFHGGLTGAPYTSGNSFIDNYITDWYYYCVYADYSKNMTIRGNDMNRMARTTLTPGYFMYAWYMQGLMFEQNTIHDLFNMNQTLSGTLYGFYYNGYGSPAPSNRNTYRNNIIRDIKWNGSVYMFYYNYNSNNDYYNNTFSWDYATTTSGTIYIFYYCYASGSNYNTWINNNFSITLGGSSTKYAMYFGGQTSLSVIEKNNYYVNSTNGYVGYWTGIAQTFANWQAQGPDPNGYGLNPNYVNVATGDLHPTNPALNNLAMPLGIIYDNMYAIRNQQTPDIGALEFLTPVCTGAPANNTVTAPNYAICPGESVSMGLAYLNPDAGFTYQWQTSNVSNVGPFTPVSGANGLFFTAPNVTQNTWYSVVITCTAPGGTSIAPVGYVQVAGPTASTVPAYESFESVGKLNRLPNCSWAASSLGSSQETYPSSNTGNRVPRTGTSFATFNNNTAGTNYYYTNPIAMNVGVTYSAAVWYATEYFGYNNWTNLSIMVGPNQNPTGMVTVASVGPAISGPYKLLDNTFTVPSSGNYYVAIKATSIAGSATYLMIDDLSITIPCGPASPNSPTVSASASSTMICAGDQVNLTAAGADTYMWSSGDQVPSFQATPMTTTNYTVVGMNATTGCTTAAVQQVIVNPSPSLFVVASNPVICAGDQVALSAFGANNYAWSFNNLTGANITVSPTVSTQYVVNGSNQYGCSASYTQQITVKAAPTLSVLSSNLDACKDDMLSLTAFGGVSYQWMSNTSPVLYQGPIINIQASSTTNFTVIAVGANGCTGKAYLTQNISECTGIEKINGSLSGVRIYPNPTAGEFAIELNNNNDKTVQVTDISGRVILSTSSVSEIVNININNLAAGVYYVKVQSNNASQVVKVVKQ